MRDLVVFGDSPFAERIASYISSEKQDNLIGFTADRNYMTRKSINGVPVYPFDELADRFSPKSIYIILGIGYTQMNNLREAIYKKCVAAGFQIGSYISVNATMYSTDIGEGVIVLPNSLIGPNCRIGKCTYIASCCAISHDNIIGDFNFLSTNVVMGGMAKIKNHCFVGLHSTIKNDISIPDYTFIGSAANLLKSPESPDGVYVGNPAKKIKNKSPFDLHI